MEVLLKVDAPPPPPERTCYLSITLTESERVLLRALIGAMSGNEAAQQVGVPSAGWRYTTLFRELYSGLQAAEDPLYGYSQQDVARRV